MRQLLPLVTLALAVSGCVSHGTGDLSSSGVDGHSFAVQRADAYIKRLPLHGSSSEKEALHRRFIQMFFSGFTSPDASMVSGSDVAHRGFREGQDFRRHSNSAKIRQTMEAFGYVYTEAEGTWSTGFETSLFRPRSVPDQKWWLNEFGNTEYVVPKDAGNESEPVLYRIYGFLSPKGEYGHMGSYDHEFYPTKVVHIKRG